MPEGDAQTTRPGEASTDSARAQVDRILASRHFAKADRLKRFLRFVCEETLNGASVAIKETVIGIEVFGRDASIYDPRIDPIVRVQAGRVRAKLDDYYAEEGAADPVCIELPRGQYVPRFSLRKGVTGRPRGAGAPVAPEAWQANTVAVLPFVNMSADPANEYFSDGLSEELTHALARLPSIRVTARRSVFQFKDSDRDIREIGRALGAGKIVEGSVRKADDRVRITVQLVNVADGYQLWSERYDRTMNDVFALQEEIAGAIRNAIHGRLGERVHKATVPTASVAALNHYLLGRFHWNKRNEAGLRAGIAHFNEAIALDAGYGRAWSGLADCWIMLAMSGAERPAACMPLARDAALRAVEIDDRLVEAHTSLAVVRANFDWDRTGSEIEFHRALERDPSYATLHHWYSLYSLTPEGRFEEAEDEIEKAERLDPISLPICMGHAQALFLAGNPTAAVAQCRRVLGLDATYYRAYWFLGQAHDRLGDFAAAVDALEAARQRCGGEVAFRGRIVGALGHACGRAGKVDRAAAILDEMTALSKTHYIDPFDIAQVHAGLGQIDAALLSLERAAGERSGYLVFSGVWPAFEHLRPESRFQTILEAMSLASGVSASI